MSFPLWPSHDPLNFCKLIEQVSSKGSLQMATAGSNQNTAPKSLIPFHVAVLECQRLSYLQIVDIYLAHSSTSWEFESVAPTSAKGLWLLHPIVEDKQTRKSQSKKTRQHQEIKLIFVTSHIWGNQHTPGIVALYHSRRQKSPNLTIYSWFPTLNTIVMGINFPMHELWGTHSNHLLVPSSAMISFFSSSLPILGQSNIPWSGPSTSFRVQGDTSERTRVTQQDHHPGPAYRKTWLPVPNMFSFWSTVFNKSLPLHGLQYPHTSSESQEYLTIPPTPKCLRFLFYRSQ